MPNPQAEDLYQQYQRLLDERDKEVARAEALDDAIREALDVTSGWTPPMTRKRRLARIDAGLREAIQLHGIQNRNVKEK